MSVAHFDPAERKDENGVIRFMCRSGGYVMCRRPRAIPFVLTEKQWMRLEKTQPTAA